MSTTRDLDFKPPRRPVGAFFHWETPGQPISVHFHLNVVDLLERNAIRRGENGTAGVLLGRTENGECPALIVEDSEPFPISAHRTESDSPFGDPEKWGSILDHWRSRPQKRISVVGFYRSCVGGKKALDRHDLEILETNSTEAEQIFLLIEPHLNGPSSGFLFMCRDGDEAWKWDEIPFNRNELTRRGTSQRSINAAPELRTLPSRIKEVSKNQEIQLRPEKGLEGSSSLHWLLGSSAVLAVIVTIMITLGGSSFRTGSTKADMADESALGLKTQHNGADLRVSWNRSAPVFLMATAGHLLITDGSVQKSVDLDLNELRSGGISYSPVTDDVALQLDVVNGKSGTIATESLRVIGGTSTASPNYAQDSTKAPGLGVHTAQAPPPTANVVRASEKSTSKSSLATAALIHPRPAPSEHAANNAATPSSVTDPLVHEESALKTSLDATMPEVGASSPRFSMPASSELDMKPSLPGMEAPSSRPAIAQDSQVEPPTLIVGKDPVYPDLARHAGISGTVKIDFTIDSNGSVRNVSGVTGPPLLASGVIEAVKARRYKPARVNGKPIDSRVSLAFVFRLN